MHRSSKELSDEHLHAPGTNGRSCVVPSFQYAAQTGGKPFEEVRRRTGEPVKPILRKTPSKPHSAAIDRALVEKALRIVEEGDFTDLRDRELSLASLGSIACQLWESAQHASVYHQQVLSAVDNACILMAGALSHRVRGCHPAGSSL